MKKKFMFAFIAAFAMVAGYNVYKSQSVMANMSEFALANVEALAQTEIGPAPDGDRYTCAYGIQYGGVGFARNCESNCSWAYFISSYSGTAYCYK